MSLLSCLRESQTTKPVAFEATKVASLPDPNAEDDAADGTICESTNKLRLLHIVKGRRGSDHPTTTMM